MQEFDWHVNEDFSCGCYISRVADIGVVQVIETEEGRWMSRTSIGHLTLTDGDLRPFEDAKRRSEFLFGMLAEATGLS